MGNYGRDFAGQCFQEIAKLEEIGFLGNTPLGLSIYLPLARFGWLALI
jgi:hypothetical protein